MNEYDDILNRIVEEFYDTGRLVLNELGGHQENIKNEISKLSFGSRDKRGKDLVNIYISMVENFLSLRDPHRKIIEEKHWWGPDIYVKVIDEYLNNKDIPYTDKIDFYERIKKISDKLDNTPFSELKDSIKPIENFLRDKERLASNLGNTESETEPPIDDGNEVGSNLDVPDESEESSDTEETPEEEKKDITSLAKEVSGFSRKSIELGDEANKILNTLITDPQDIKDVEGFIAVLKNEIGDLRKEIDDLRGQNQKSRFLEKMGQSNVKSEELKGWKQELKDLKSNPILYLLLNKRCLINTLVYGDPKSSERENLVNRIKNFFKKESKTYGVPDKYRLHEKQFKKFVRNYGKPLAKNIKSYIETPGMKPKTTDEDLEFCGVEEFENSKIISRKKEEIKKEHSTDNTKIPVLLDQAFNLVNEIFNEFMTNTKLKQKYAKTDRYNKLIDIIKNYWSGDNDDERLYSLYNIIFDLNELLKLIKGLDKTRNIPKEIDDLINNIYKNVNDSDIIRDNFKEIRENNNLKYEKSFGCNNNEYFSYTTEGDTSAILGSSVNNNQILKNMMNIIISSMKIPETYTEKDKDGNDVNHKSQDFIDKQKFNIEETYRPKFSDETYDKKIEWCVNTLYNNIKSDDINKYDIISTSNVTVGSGSSVIVIPKDSKIEVKDTDSKEYHLSEFFGVYKDSDLPLGYKKIPQYRKIYNDIIEGLYNKIIQNDKGILDKIYKDTKGLFFRNYNYIPLEKGMLSWSLDGQRKVSEGLPEYRLSVRVNMEGKTEYQWTTENGNCNCEPFLKGVECPQNEPTDRLDEIIENFFDTGKFIL
jgi:hypothetical protein